MIDVLRYIVFGQGSVVLLISALIIVRYASLLRNNPNPKRALPWHIFLIAISFSGATVFICMELYQRLNQPMTYRTPFGLAIFTLGDMALCLMIVHLVIQRRLMDRIRRHLESEEDCRD